ncbi:MAG TPA: sigma 54-interacting transcriptional regulator [Polyangiaceae bacterium]|nr:sigma 54-interacting transcriptional regulator [Polyangiaceae bacterium]
MLETTINTRDDSTPPLGSAGLSLRWLFPDATRPPVPLRQNCRIGRDPQCLVLIDGPGVSRQHAEIALEDDGFVLRDLGSTNGTYLNAQSITQAVLEPGALLRIGNWVGLFERGPSRMGAALSELAPGLWGGPELAAVMDPARRAAATDLPIVIVGETGTGKEVAARAIHGWSGRSGPFSAINCAALPEQLVEGELFGYRRGAFTGAERNHPGYFRSAQRGTLLLDEVIDLGLATQAKLLRVLQERELVPLGESVPVPIDVRIVVAAQMPLSAAVAAGRFREDLAMRLSGLELPLPPLRARVGDIPALFLRFLGRDANAAVRAVEGKLIESLCSYPWSGNVRQLELLARRLIALHAAEPVLLRSHLPAEMQTRPAPTPSAPPGEETQRDRELTQLAALLEKHQGNMSRACTEMNISRARGYRLLGGMSVEQLLAQRAGGR